MTELTIQEILQDLLCCEKYMLEMYKQYTIETSNSVLKELCMKNMKEVFEMQQVIYENMKERDLYPVEFAESQKISQAIKTIQENTKYYDDTF